MYHVGFDDLMAVAVNGSWIWSDYNGGSWVPEQNQWGRYVMQCTSYDSEGCLAYGQVFQSQWERKKNWNYDTNVNFIPYLREGRNVIRVDTGVVGAGEGWIFLEISAWRAKCSTVTINECGQYENAK